MVYFYYRLYLNLSSTLRAVIFNYCSTPYSGSFRTTYFRGKYARFRLHYFGLLMSSLHGQNVVRRIYILGTRIDDFSLKVACDWLLKAESDF